MNTRRVHGAILVALSLFGDIAAEELTNRPTFMFDIPSGDAAATLPLYASQAHIEMLYVPDTVRGIRTSRVYGRHSPREAMEQMLGTAPVTYRFEQDLSFVAILPRGTLSHDEGLKPAAVSACEIEKTQGVGQPRSENVLVTGTLISGVTELESPVRSESWKSNARPPYATMQEALQSLPMSPATDFAQLGIFSRGTSAMCDMSSRTP